MPRRTHSINSAATGAPNSHKTKVDITSNQSVPENTTESEHHPPEYTQSLVDICRKGGQPWLQAVFKDTATRDGISVALSNSMTELLCDPDITMALGGDYHRHLTNWEESSPLRADDFLNLVMDPASSALRERVTLYFVKKDHLSGYVKQGVVDLVKSCIAVPSPHQTSWIKNVFTCSDMEGLVTSIDKCWSEFQADDNIQRALSNEGNSLVHQIGRGKLHKIRKVLEHAENSRSPDLQKAIESFLAKTPCLKHLLKGGHRMVQSTSQVNTAKVP